MISFAKKPPFHPTYFSTLSQKNPPKENWRYSRIASQSTSQESTATSKNIQKDSSIRRIRVSELASAASGEGRASELSSRRFFATLATLPRRFPNSLAEQNRADEFPALQTLSICFYTNVGKQWTGHIVTRARSSDRFACRNRRCEIEMTLLNVLSRHIPRRTAHDRNDPICTRPHR